MKQWPKILIALFLVCLIAPLKFNVFGVPFILYSFAILTAASVLGARAGILIASLYLALGAAGMPVFAGWDSGFAKFSGPTAGFLLSLPLVAGYLGWQCQAGEQSWFHYMIYFFRAHIIWLVIGFSVLYWSLEGLNFMGTLVKLLPDVLAKSILGGLVAHLLAKKIPPL